MSGDSAPFEASLSRLYTSPDAETDALRTCAVLRATRSPTRREGDAVSVSHPQPTVIADELERLAKFLRTYFVHDKTLLRKDRCQCTVCLADRLGSRGYPTNTAGGIRSSDNTSSTERAAGVLSDTATLQPGPFAGIDETLHKYLRILMRSAVNVQSTAIRVMSHGTDDDPIPAGTGPCQRCPTFCRPDADHPNNRIVSGFCPTCYKAYDRAGKPDRGLFIRAYPQASRGTVSTTVSSENHTMSSDFGTVSLDVTECRP